MLIKKPAAIRPSEITAETLYKERRRFLGALSGGAVTFALGAAPGLMLPGASRASNSYSTTEELTPQMYATNYNNFYEFGTEKELPVEAVNRFKPRPWSIAIEGEVAHPAHYPLEDFLKPYTLEERIYRHRCVEGWSMVIPWLGFPLRDLIKRAAPNTNAKYLEFTTLYDPEQMPNQKRPILQWPYTEGLRLDEAMHPLTILAVGMYGAALPNQNGAPLRLIVPWKYGFKGIKSIVKIRFTQQRPITTWMQSSMSEYGFYANVNPAVDHPRWSQSRERRIGEFFKRKTLLFNGYEKEVAVLYAGMDLRKNF